MGLRPRGTRLGSAAAADRAQLPSVASVLSDLLAAEPTAQLPEKQNQCPARSQLPTVAGALSGTGLLLAEPMARLPWQQQQWPTRSGESLSARQGAVAQAGLVGGGRWAVGRSQGWTAHSELGFQDRGAGVEATGAFG